MTNEKRPKVAHYGDPELLEEYPGQVDREAESLYITAHPKGEWWKLHDQIQSQWRKQARRMIVERDRGR